MKSKGFASVNTLAALKTALQGEAYFGCGSRETAEAIERPLTFKWLRPHSSGWREAMVAGAHVVIGLRDRRRYVGKLISFTAQSVVLVLWGWGGAVTRFATSAVIGGSVVGSHSHREEREVMRRQRRGEPAHVEQPARSKQKAETPGAELPGAVSDFPDGSPAFTDGEDPGVRFGKMREALRIFLADGIKLTPATDGEGRFYFFDLAVLPLSAAHFPDHKPRTPRREADAYDNRGCAGAQCELDTAILLAFERALVA